MAKFINNENGVIWIESTESGCFGVVDAAKILDEDGIPCTGSASENVEAFLSDIEPEQDFDNETTTFQLENGKLVFCNLEAKFIKED